jgi:hypothetical protein
MITNVDLLSGGQGKGDVATYLAGKGRFDFGTNRPFMDDQGRSWITIHIGGDPSLKASYVTKQINTNATLRRDEWKQLDDALLVVNRERLGGIQDLVSKGLVYNLGNAMGTTVLEWHDVSDAMTADVTMDGVTRSKGDRPKFQYNYIPIPIIHVDYEINARALAASRNLGNPLDVADAEFAARRVAEKLEDMLFTNTTYSFGATDSRGRNSIYSYINHPDRTQVAFTDIPGGHWNDSGTTGRDIVDGVIALKQYSINALHYGPWILYIPTAYETELDKNIDSTTPNITIRARLKMIDGIIDVKVNDRLPADNMVLVQMTSDVVRLVRGMALQNVEWATEGGMVTKYKVMTIQVPQLRSDQNGRTGIIHVA